MRKIIILIAILLICAASFFAQSVSLDKLKNPHLTGFKTLLLADNSRQFKFKEQTQSVNRPIRLFVWYPAVNHKNKQFSTFADYVYTSSLTKEPNQLTNLEKDELEKKLVKTLEFSEVSTEQVAALMKAQTTSISNVSEKKGKFPLIVLGNVGEGFYYSATAEFLAANGFVVVSLPSLGANEGERCGFDLNCLKLQQADMESAINRLKTFPNVDTTKIGLIAWSFSGLAVAHLSLQNQAVKIAVSLDAATGYQYGKDILDQSKELELSKTNTPFLHFHGLGGEARVPKNFDFFNAYQSKEKRLVTFKNLQHSDFVSLYGNAVRFAKNENDTKATSAIRWVNLITLDFLNAHLKNDRKSLQSLNDALKNDNQTTAEIFSFSTSYQK